MSDRFQEQLAPMNEEAIAYLNSIVVKDENSLLAGEKEFIRARKMYLTPGEQEKFQNVLRGEEVVIEQPTQEEESDIVPLKGQSTGTDVKIPYRDLQKLATQHGIKAVGISYDDLLVKVQEVVNQTK